MSISYLSPGRDVCFTETDTGYCLTVDLHGLTQAEIKVSAYGQFLVIEGIGQTHASEDRDDGVSPSSLRNAVGLPTDADWRRLTWGVSNGLLVVTVDAFAYLDAA